MGWRDWRWEGKRGESSTVKGSGFLCKDFIFFGKVGDRLFTKSGGAERGWA